jgi:hypothetical protein
VVHPAGRTWSGSAVLGARSHVTPTLRPLRGYEPSGALTVADLGPTERWSSPRPSAEPQVTVAEEPDDGQFRVMLTKILEVLDGRRHIGQLRTLLADPVYEATLTRLRTMPKGVRYSLYSIHTCWPNADAVELSGRVETGWRGSRRRRVQALVVRVERREGAWRVVFLRML